MLSSRTSAMMREHARPTAELIVPDRPDRRARRRQETIEEILDIADDVMTEEGVNGLSLSEVARRLGVQPPSLYKYFASLLAIYDALFQRGQRAHLETMRGRDGRRRTRPRRADRRARGQRPLVCWPTGRWPSCCSGGRSRTSRPRAEAMAPSLEMVRLQRQALADAVAAGQLGAGADSDEAIYGDLGLHQRRHRPGDGQRTRPALGRGPLQPDAPQASRHTRRPLPPEARPPRVVTHRCQRGQPGRERGAA